MAERRVVFPAMCGVTVISRSSMKVCRIEALVGRQRNGLPSVCEGAQSYRAQPAVRHGQTPALVAHQPRARCGSPSGAWLIWQSLASMLEPLIAGRGVGLVAAFLAAEVDLFIPSTARRRFDRCPSSAWSSSFPRLPPAFSEPPVPVLGERRVIPDRIVDAKPDEPAVQQLELQPFHHLAFRVDCEERVPQ